VIQLLDANREPREYFMDVDSVVCADSECEIITVRIHFDPLGNYLRYELPAGGNLTKWGHKPFSLADHQNLHQILANPYSQLKSVAWDQITMPKNAAAASGNVDGIAGATMLSKRSIVVVGAAYTCCTLWHWTHGGVGKVIREMTGQASDKRDLIRYLNGGDEAYAAFALDQLRERELFDTEAIDAVVAVVRQGSHQLTKDALSYLEAASDEQSVDYFFCRSEDDDLVADALKRVRFLEALRDTDRKPPPGFLHRLGTWLGRADSHYEVHLLLSLLERDRVTSDQVISGAMSLLESEDSLVVRRCCRYLESQQLNQSQRDRFEAFKQGHPDL
jgi:hypothetical protein